MEQEPDTVDNNHLELDMADKAPVSDMADSKDRHLDKMDSMGKPAAMVDMPLASCRLEASFQMATSLGTWDTDNAG